ncbi:nuclear transport factor 2 family protein [Tateyamaria omphalii]|uniref:nuclear transport factor 2 family protein n=1 Tax=Tateyamaria omphalii TaxID=299262 RepID=UPI001C999138|nr:nuclear transport factor 2 family protein [Tateyamaria omphalii]MBY5935132.1 nuclear transport factor 2 family protein [Tateyamaria omphalii]
MQTEHANIDLIAKIDITDIPAQADLFQRDVVWHFFNPMAPNLAGSYRGVDGIAEFFDKVRGHGHGSFAVQPKLAWAVGDELVVVQSRNRLGQGIEAINFDVVVVWRIIDGKIAEVWDIPAVNTIFSNADLAKTSVI